LSLMALTLSVGFVVDDAIVVLENIVRHMEMGKPPMEAALEGSREIGFTIISMTISLVAVFIPVLFMGGLIGRLLHAFAINIAATVYLFQITPKGFLPSEDVSRIFAQTEAAEGTSFDAMVRYQQAAADVVRADTNVDSFMSSIGSRGGQATGSNTGTLFMKLK